MCASAAWRVGPHKNKAIHSQTRAEGQPDSVCRPVPVAQPAAALLKAGGKGGETFSFM